MKNTKEFGEYTRWSGRKTFKEEKEMVIWAVENDEPEKIKKYLTPLIQYWTDGFKKHAPTHTSNEDLLDAGFKHLELALKKYKEKLEDEKIGFKFSTYYEWYVRQGIVEYLNSLK